MGRCVGTEMQHLWLGTEISTGSTKAEEAATSPITSAAGCSGCERKLRHTTIPYYNPRKNLYLRKVIQGYAGTPRWLELPLPDMASSPSTKYI